MNTSTTNLATKRSLTRRATQTLALVAGTALCLSVLTPWAIANEPDIKTETRSSQVFMLNENGRKIEVRIDDGKLSTATVDGKSLPSERVRIEKDRVVITNDDGTTLAQIDIPDSAEMKIERRADNERVFRILPDRLTRRDNREADADENAARERLAQPEIKRDVMLGLRQAPVSGVLARHLNLEPGVGSLVAGVAKGMPASVAGLKPYDVIVSFNNEPVTSAASIVQFLSDKQIKPGQLIKLGVIQQGTRKELTLSPVAFDDASMEKAEWDEAESADIDTMGMGGNMLFREGEAPGAQMFIRPFGLDGLDQGKMNDQIRAQIERLMRQQQRDGGAIDRFEIAPPRDRENDNENKALRKRLDRMEKQLQQLLEQSSKKP